MIKSLESGARQKVRVPDFRKSPGKNEQGGDSGPVREDSQAWVWGFTRTFQVISYFVKGFARA